MDLKRLLSSVLGLIYRFPVKPVFFRIDAEKVHVGIVGLGNSMGKIAPVRYVVGAVLNVSHPRLEQQISGIRFRNPVGLAAGFDYEANLTGILPAVGFGFQSIGTLTRLAYGRNPGPMLGRLPNSRSLMVNKGYKNLGAEKTINKLSGLKFSIPVGISIGRTNSPDLKTQKQSIADILKSFQLFEKSKLAHSYYELNISCPNLYGNVSFYPPKNLEELLKEIDKLKLKKPVFVKMPISETDKDIRKMLEVISGHTPVGVIIGNLQTNRKILELDPQEVARFPRGNFSGKPTYLRSNNLIRAAYSRYKNRFTVIGCGGIFSAEDAYEKITLGATLVQLITGMIYEGPQLIAQINLGLLDLLERDGLTDISQAVGIRGKKTFN